MDCKYTCFDRVMHLVKPLREKDKTECIDIIINDGFHDFMDYCEEKGCFNKYQAHTLCDGIIMWEDLDGNYWEEDREKLLKLYDAVGIEQHMIHKFCEMYPDRC